MTYFLNSQDAPPEIAANHPDIDLPSWGDGVSAAFGLQQLETDANFRYRRELIAEKDDLARNVIEQIGADRVRSIIDERNTRAKEQGFDSKIRDMPENLVDTVDAFGPMFSEQILELAREDAEANPDAWSEYDLTEEGIETAVNTRLKAEHHNLQMTLAMMTNGQAIAGLVGGMAGAVVDAKTLPFMALGGGGGSIVRIMSTEALINAGAELATMPSQFKMAERLEIEDPNVLAQVGLAAAGGGLLAGGAVAGQRSLSYILGRSQTPPVPGRTDVESRILVDKAEDILATSDDPIADLVKLVDENPANKINPSREPLVLHDPIDLEIDRDAIDLEIDAAQGQLVSDFPEMRFKNPLAEFILNRGGVKYKRLDPATGDMVLTPIAEELANAGITIKTHPRIWRKDGMESLDNIPISEGDGLGEVIRGADDGLYFDPEDLTAAMARELSTGEKTPMSGEIFARMDQISNIGKSPEADFISGKRSEEPDGLYLSREDVEAFLGEAWTPDTARTFIEAEVDDWLTRRGYADQVLPEERAEVIAAMMEHGGDAEYLLERLWERELGYAALPAREVPDYADFEAIDPTTPTNAGRSETPDGRSVQDPETASGSAARGADDPGATEATDAGEQRLIDGVAPVSQRQRLEAAQNAPLRGGDRAADDGLFDVAGRSQGDMFDDITSPEARVIHDAVEADILSDIEAGKSFEVDMGDGKGTRPVEEALSDIKDLEEFSEIIDLCGRPK